MIPVLNKQFPIGPEMPIPGTSPVQVRAATTSDLAAIARIHMASWHDAYRGVIPDDILDGRTVEGSLSGWRSTFEKYPDNISVAERGDALLAGFCCAGPVVDAEKNAPFEFEICGLHVAPIMRRRDRRGITSRGSKQSRGS